MTPMHDEKGRHYKREQELLALPLEERNKKRLEMLREDQPRAVDSGTLQDVHAACRLASDAPFGDSPFYSWLQKNSDLDCVKSGRFIDCLFLFLGEFFPVYLEISKSDPKEDSYAIPRTARILKGTLETYWTCEQKKTAHEDWLTQARTENERKEQERAKMGMR